MGKKVFPLLGPAIFESVNRLNDLALTEDEFALEDFKLDPTGEYNSSCLLVAKPDTLYRGNVKLRYNRLNIDSAKSWLYDAGGESAFMVLVNEKHLSTKAIMADFNEMAGMNVPIDDIVDDPIDWSGPNPPLITLRTNPDTATTFTGEIRCRLLLKTRIRVEVVLDIDAVGVDGTFFTTTTDPKEITIDWDDGRGPGQNFQVYSQGTTNYIGIKSNTNDLLGVRSVVISGARGVRFTEVAPSQIKVIELVEYSTDESTIQPLFINTFDSLKQVHSGAFQRCIGTKSVVGILKGQTKITEYPPYLFAWLPFLTDVRQALQNNTSLVSTPEYIVTGTQVKNVDYLFSGCSSIETARATTLLGAKTIQTASYILANCKSLVTVEDGFFNTQTAMLNVISAFDQCVSITRYPDRLFQYCPISQAGYLFAGNSSLVYTGKRPFGDTPKLVGANRLYQGTQSLTSIDEDLFYNCATLNQCEYLFGSSGLTSIPAGLFQYSPNITTMLYGFSYCNITAIPDRLFAKSVKITTFESCFMENKSLTHIGDDIFGNNNACLNVRWMFRACYNLEEIPPDLLRYLPNLNAATGLFYAHNPSGPEKSKIKSIPVDIFRYNTKMASIDSAFNGLVSVTHIPGGMFKSFTAAYTEAGITSLFQNMSGVLTMDEDVLDGLNPTPTSGVFQLGNSATRSGCFSGMTSLTAIPEKIFSYVPRVNSLSFVFRECGAPNIPANLFKHNERIVNINGIFMDMPNLITLPPSLFTDASTIQQAQEVFVNTMIRDVPEGFVNGLTYNNVNLTSMFSKCYNLETDINKIFNLPAGSYSHIAYLTQIFYLSAKLTGDALAWRLKFPHIPDNGAGGTRSVSGCPLLENINSLPYAWRML